MPVAQTAANIPASHEATAAATASAEQAMPVNMPQTAANAPASDEATAADEVPQAVNAIVTSAAPVADEQGMTVAMATGATALQLEPTAAPVAEQASLVPSEAPIAEQAVVAGAAAASLVPTMSPAVMQGMLTQTRAPSLAAAAEQTMPMSAVPPT